MPSNPKTPLSPKRLEAILKGTADVGDSGVVTVTVSRKDRIVIDGVKVNPDVNISTGVAFQPLNAAGTRAAVAPDFSMTSREIKPVMRTMRGLGFEVGCLYNQETSESPQLFFAHMFAAGDPYDLAHRIRRGLDHTNSD
jgi:hypothetical protein